MSVEASGVSFSARVGPIVDKGLVGPDFKLENTMPLTINRFNLTGEIRFDNPQVEEAIDDGSEQVSGSAAIPSVFIEAFSPDAKLKKIWDELREQPSLTEDMLYRALLAKDALTRTTASSQEQASSIIHLQPEAKAVNQHSNSLPHPGLFHTPVEQTAPKEKVTQNERIDQKPHALTEERVEVKRRRFVLDERALGVRIVEIKSAARKAKDLAFGWGVKITGFLIAAFLPGQHAGNESEAVKGKGTDGSIPETAEAIKNHGEFTSDLEAESASIKEAYKAPPIKVRPEGEGKQVEDEKVYIVYKDHPVKPNLQFLLIDRLNKEG